MEEIKIKIIVDIEDLNNFYKDDRNPDWGGSNDPCTADPFCKIFATDCSFTGPTGSIIDFNANCKYIWTISVLDEDGPVKEVDDCSIIMEMIQLLPENREPKKEDWEKIFIFNDQTSVDADGRLSIIEVENDKIIINTINKIEKDYNLTYSVKFRFFDPVTGKYRYCRIDPFLKIRSNPGPGN